MPNIGKNATDHIVGAVSAEMMSEIATESAKGSTTPFITCGVNRRINLGNYEHLDIFSGVSLPIGTPLSEEMSLAINAKIGEAMVIASKEVNNRYQGIKEAQGEGR